MANKLDNQQKVRLAIWYENLKSIVTVQRNFRKEYRTRAPRRDSILRYHANLMRYGSVWIPKDESEAGRPISARSAENIDKVLEAFRRSPEKSIRRASLQLDLNKTTIHRILKAAKLKAYKPQILHALYDEDIDRRMEFAELTLEKINSESDFLSLLIFSDEATFHVDGKVNKQNWRFWSDENPHFYVEKSLQSPKVVVWCAVWAGGLIGPYFFDGTLTGDSYLEMLQNFFWPLICDLPEINDLIFQQDGAPPHYAINVREFLDESFPQRWIGRRGPVEWPTRSPDLTPLDFWLWGYLKSKVYEHRIEDVDDLKIKIREACANISQDMCKNSLGEFKNRMEKVIEIGGGHIEQL